MHHIHLWIFQDAPCVVLASNYTAGLKDRMTFFPPKFFHWKLEWRTKMDVEILLKFYLSVRIMLVNVDKNVQNLFDQTCLPVVPGSPNLYLFVGLECLRSICLQNIWILYIYILKKIYVLYIYNNPFLLLLNVPQILKTGIHLQFQKISDWPIWFLIDPLYKTIS